MMLFLLMLALQVHLSRWHVGSISLKLVCIGVATPRQLVMRHVLQLPMLFDETPEVIAAAKAELRRVNEQIEENAKLKARLQVAVAQLQCAQMNNQEAPVFVEPHVINTWSDDVQCVGGGGPAQGVPLAIFAPAP